MKKPLGCFYLLFAVTLLNSNGIAADDKDPGRQRAAHDKDSDRQRAADDKDSGHQRITD